jgi:regulator of sirC expression with transglutaminase-like and TPR domain
MENEAEINALINLVDDEDESIYFQIREKILSHGLDAIPYLENAWEHKDLGQEFQTRVEDLIHDIQFSDVTESLKKWVEKGGVNLVTGILLLNKHHYPELNISHVKSRIEDIVIAIKANWNENLSERQKVVAINRALFAHFNFRGDNDDYYSPSNSILSKVLERRKGNPLMMSVLYMEVARQLGVKIVGINLPRHFVVALKVKNEIQFYISPFNNGTVMTLADLKDYLLRLNLPFEEVFLQECDNIAIVKRVLLNLSNSYMKLKNKEKLEEVNFLYKIVNGDD